MCKFVISIKKTPWIYFLKDKYKYKDIKLYLVSDSYGVSEKYKTYEEYRKIQDKKQRIQGKDSLRVDCNFSSRLYKFKGRVVSINYDIPLNPIIKKISKLPYNIEEGTKKICMII